MSVDLAVPLRAAVVGASAVTSLLPSYLGSFPVFTRRPAPEDAPSPMIMISPDVAFVEQDGLDDERPIITRDLAAYGHNDAPASYVAVESVAYALRVLFHRQRRAISVAGWTVVEITAQGPRPAPVDDEQTIGRVVSLTIQLARKN